MVAALVLALLSAPPAGHAGRVVAVSGDVSLARNNSATPLARGTYLLTGDVVNTRSDGSVRMLMRDKSVLALPARSSIKISAYDVEPASKRRRARLTVLAGRLWALVTEAVHPDATYEVSTDNAVAGVRGTELVFDVDATGDSVTVITGEVELASTDGKETLGARERGSVAGGDIALKSTTEKAITEIRDGVRPEQELDTAKADKRLAAARAKNEDPAAPGLADEQEVEHEQRDDPGTGDAVFEDLLGRDNESAEPEPPIGTWFDPSTMGRVRVRVEVRP